MKVKPITYIVNYYMNLLIGYNQMPESDKIAF